MNKIDTIAIMLFVLWIFGFIHIIVAIVVVAILAINYRRRRVFRRPKGESKFHKMLRSHDAS